MSRTTFDLMCWGERNCWWQPPADIMADLRAMVARDRGF